MHMTLLLIAPRALIESGDSKTREKAGLKALTLREHIFDCPCFEAGYVCKELREAEENCMTGFCTRNSVDAAGTFLKVTPLFPFGIRS